MRYNLKFRKLTLYGLARPQSITKLKQISGKTILSSPQDLEFNPSFAKNRDIPVVKKQRYKARHASVTDRYALNNLIKGRLKTSSKLNPSVNLFSILIHCSIFFRYNIQRPRDSLTQFHVQFQTGTSLKKWNINRNKSKT